MNTNQLKRFAQAARTKLMEQVGARLDYILQTDTAELREKAEALRKLQEAINAASREQVIEKIAYTWFNRLVALRFMDVNHYQPLGVRVVTPKEGYTLPEILEEAKHGHISGELPVDRTHVMELLDGLKPSANPQNEAYKELFIAACNHLNRIFPFLFERIDDYAELLLPDDLLSEYSILQDVREGMEADDCREVEIIGWLYQFYISEKKDEVFASKKSVKKEDIPAATQLFTPRWIVEYMVQNTVGKLWLQNRPYSKLRDHMEYYIESPSSQSEDFLKLRSIEELTLLDQACGSGHILVYAFELLYKIYEEEGYNPSEIPELIIQNNLFGFEIDERAAQLSSLAIMMKARSYHRRFFRKAAAPLILRFQDVVFSDAEIEEVLELTKSKTDTLKYDLKTMQQATNYGSLIIPRTTEEELTKALQAIENKLAKTDLFQQESLQKLKLAVQQLLPLSRKYHCIVDNPPYMGGGNMNKELGDFVKTNYPNSKADLMACFMEAGLRMLHQKGFLGMINQHSWMFLSSYENLRNKLIESAFFDTNLHLGARTFPEIGGEVVQNTSFTFWNHLKEDKGVYFRLVDFGSSDLKRTKTLEAIQNPQCGWFYNANQKDFEKIPGSPIGYWISKKVVSLFEKSDLLKKNFKFKRGIGTGDNDRFLRFWNEIRQKDIQKKWFTYNKGGERRRWYGNRDYVINWFKDGFDIKNLKDKNGKLRSRPQNLEFNLKLNVSYSSLTSSDPTFRIYENFINDQAGNYLIANSQSETFFLLALLNSKIGKYFIQLKNQTLNITADELNAIPIIKNNHFLFQEKLLNISKQDWDSRETSWDFVQNELINCKSHCGQNVADLDMLDEEDRKDILATTHIPTDANSIEHCYNAYQNKWTKNFYQLHQNEEELNRQFIEIYGLQEELTPDVPLEDITILKEETVIQDGELVFRADAVMAQFVSYAVGCMFGRYSIDKHGIILANQGETLSDYIAKVQKEGLNSPLGVRGFLPDEDNIIPVLDEEWFEDDIVGRFHQFLKASFGTENFEKNLAFVEDALGMDMRRYFTRSFYADHIKRYKKRPIYWMFSSPKGSFSVLIYMHRYTQDTLNKILNGYLREFKNKIQAYMMQLDHIVETGSSSDAVKANKQLDKYKLILLELQEYERSILYPLATERISIDLDDGVLVNYNKFGTAIKAVDGLNDKKTKKKVKEFDWINGEEIR